MRSTLMVALAGARPSFDFVCFSGRVGEPHLGGTRRLRLPRWPSVQSLAATRCVGLRCFLGPAVGRPRGACGTRYWSARCALGSALTRSNTLPSASSPGRQWYNCCHRRSTRLPVHLLQLFGWWGMGALRSGPAPGCRCAGYDRARVSHRPPRWRERLHFSRCSSLQGVATLIPCDAIRPKAHTQQRGVGALVHHPCRCFGQEAAGARIGRPPRRCPCLVGQQSSPVGGPLCMPRLLGGRSVP